MNCVEEDEPRLDFGKEGFSIVSMVGFDTMLNKEYWNEEWAKNELLVYWLSKEIDTYIH